MGIPGRYTMYDERNLAEKAHEAMKNSYCKYSGFAVGAALLCDDGTVYSGCNVENASYGAANCAERTAIFKAVSEGHRKFTAIAICGGKDINNTIECPPCGICRQVMNEFCDSSFEIILPVFKEGSIAGVSKHTLADMLPYAFDL